MRSKLYRRL